MGLDAALALLIALLNQSANISALIKTMRAEGRTEPTPQEWGIILSRDDAARVEQMIALDRMKARGSLAPPPNLPTTPATDPNVK